MQNWNTDKPFPQASLPCLLQDEEEVRVGLLDQGRSVAGTVKNTVRRSRWRHGCTTQWSFFNQQIIFEVSTVYEKGYEQRPRSSTYDPSPGRLINCRCDDKGNIKQSLRIRMFRVRPWANTLDREKFWITQSKTIPTFSTKLKMIGTQERHALIEYD